MTGTHDIRGTWFPTGFHGHFRSKSRSEFTIPYRHRAKPVPPEKFLNNVAERSNRHLFSRHDNRHAHSDMGDLETYFGMGMGKRKYLYSSETQHTKSSRDIITWRGNECPSPTTTYRADFPSTSRITSNLNESEPIHVRSNLELRRRQLRATSAPPSHRRTAPLLAWNEPDESQHGKPGVGIRQPIRNQRPSFASETPFAHTAPAAVRSQTAPSQSFTVSETIVPLNATWILLECESYENRTGFTKFAQSCWLKIRFQLSVRKANPNCLQTSPSPFAMHLLRFHS